MNKVQLNVWGRFFDLEVIYDCFDDEKVLASQEEAFHAFCAAGEAIARSQKDIEKYCMNQNPKEINMDSIDNIFKYVIPKYIYITRSEKDHVVALMCNYRFDMDNGIAMVFKNETLVEIGSQDIIL